MGSPNSEAYIAERWSTSSWLVWMALVLGFFCYRPIVVAQQEVNGDQSPTAPQLIPRAKASNQQLLLGPGDSIEVQVFNTPELSAKYQVSQEGTVRIAGVGNVKVGGLTSAYAGAEIEHRLREAEIMLEPQVTVFVSDYAPREITVLGEVNRPGIYSLRGSPSLSSALAAAGGVTPKEGETITVTHFDNPIPDVISGIDANHPAGNQRSMILQALDIVLVSQIGSIYVVGDVQHPGEFLLKAGQPLGALEALALAQGATSTANPQKASIIHPTQNGVASIPVNLTRIAKGTANDRVLEPSDVLVIPYSRSKDFQRAILPGLVGAVASAAIFAMVTH